MSMTALFIANHKNILKAGPCMLVKEHGSPHPSLAHTFRMIGETGYFSQDDKTKTFYSVNIAPVRGGMGSVLTHGVSGGMEGIRLQGAGADEGVRYLDYFADGCTSMALDAAAKVVFTGPLEGCFVAVGRGMGPSTYLFHANDNKTKGDSTKNASSKLAMIRDASQAYFSCRLEEMLMAKDYKNADEPYRAFVYGINGGGGWDFYFHSAILDNNRWKVIHASDPLPRMV